MCGTVPPLHTCLNKLRDDFTFLLLLAIPRKLWTWGSYCAIVLKMSI